MPTLSKFNEPLPHKVANKIANEVLVTIASESKKEKISLDQMSTLTLTAFLLSIQPTIERIITKKGRDALTTYVTAQLVSLNVAKKTLLNIVDSIKDD